MDGNRGSVGVAGTMEKGQHRGKLTQVWQDIAARVEESQGVPDEGQHNNGQGIELPRSECDGVLG